MTVKNNASGHGRQRYLRLSIKSLARQRGALGILGALTLLISVLFTALAVDTGRLMLEQRRLQKIADMAALDGARALACGGDVAAAVNQSADPERNNHTGDVLTVELGDVLPQDGVRVFVEPQNPNVPNAVQVTAGDTNVPASLIAGGWFGNTVNLQATAVAGARAVGTLSVGSYLGRLNPLLGPLLGGLLGMSGQLDLVSYQGVLNAANVTLLDLINVRGGVGTVDKLLDLDISMKDFALLVAEALSNNPDSPTAVVELLETIAVQADADLHLRLGDLLQLDLPADQAALSAKLNVLDLIGLGAEVANARHAVEAALPINIPGIATATLTTYIIEPPQIGIGPAGRDADGEWITRAHTAQVNVQLHLRLLEAINLGTPGTGVVNLDLAINGADARAGFENFDCTGNGRNAVVGHVASALRIGVGRFDDMSKLKPQIVPSQVVVVSLLGLGITARADLGLGQSVEDTGELTFYPTFPNTQNTDNNPLGTAVSTLLGDLASKLEVRFEGPLGPSLNLILQLLGLGNSQGLLDLVTNLLKPVLQALDPLLSGLLNALGVSVAGADISVMDVDGGRPQLLI